MKRHIRRAPPRRRSALATIVRQLGHGVKPSGKTYKRNPKHRNPRPRGGDYSFGVASGRLRRYEEPRLGSGAPCRKNISTRY